MKKVSMLVVMLMCVGAVSQAALVHTGTYVDMVKGTNAFDPGATTTNFDTGNYTTGWKKLDKSLATSAEYPITAQPGDGGDGWVWRADDPDYDIEFVLSGLTIGQEYTIGVVYYDQPDNSIDVDTTWGISASLDNVTFEDLCQNVAGLDENGNLVTHVLDSVTGVAAVNTNGNLGRAETFFAVVTAETTEISVYLRQYGDTRSIVEGVSYVEGNILIPEPATMVLLGLGGLLISRRKK